MSRVAIVGSRDASPELLQKVREYIASLPPGTVIVTGSWWSTHGDVIGRPEMRPTRGVDAVAALAANNAGFVVVCAAGSAKVGKMAGMARNPVIIDVADRVVAFWDGVSRGTKSGIDYCRRIDKPLLIIRDD